MNICINFDPPQTTIPMLPAFAKLASLSFKSVNCVTRANKHFLCWLNPTAHFCPQMNCKLVLQLLFYKPVVPEYQTDFQAFDLPHSQTSSHHWYLSQVSPVSQWLVYCRFSAQNPVKTKFVTLHDKAWSCIITYLCTLWYMCVYESFSWKLVKMVTQTDRG